MTKKDKNEVVDLKPIQKNYIEITIKGITPLIVNQFDEKSKRQIIESQMKKTRIKEIRNPMEEFMRAFYWLTKMPEEFTEESFAKALKEGARFGFPSKGLKASIVSGAYRNGATKDKVSLNGAFFIPDEFVEIKYEEVVMRTDYVRIARGGTDMRFRPEFRDWSITFNIIYTSNIYSIEEIVNFINLGGFSCGLGEMRADKGGNFGSYEVVIE